MVEVRLLVFPINSVEFSGQILPTDPHVWKQKTDSLKEIWPVQDFRKHSERCDLGYHSSHT